MTGQVGVWALQKTITHGMWEDGPVRDFIQRQVVTEAVQQLVEAGGDLLPVGDPRREPHLDQSVQYPHEWVDDAGEDQVTYLPVPAYGDQEPAFHLLRVEIRAFLPPEQRERQ